MFFIYTSFAYMFVVLVCCLDRMIRVLSFSNPKTKLAGMIWFASWFLLSMALVVTIAKIGSRIEDGSALVKYCIVSYPGLTLIEILMFRWTTKRALGVDSKYLAMAVCDDLDIEMSPR